MMRYLVCIFIFLLCSFSARVIFADQPEKSSNLAVDKVQDDSALSYKSQQILNKIYKRNQKKSSLLKEQSKYPQKIIVDRFVATELKNIDSGYQSEQVDSPIDIELKKPGKKLLSRNDLYKQAYDSLLAGYYETSIILFRRIFDQDSRDENALFGMAVGYHKLGEINNARKYYSEVLKINPEHQKAVNNFLILVGEESPKEAISQLQRIERVSTNNSSVKAQLSYLYAIDKNYMVAKEYIEKAILISPRNVKYQYNLAVIFDLIGDYPQAIEKYLAVLGMMENSQSYILPVDAIKKRILELRI
jgi:Tfp pilus assembly protein PilF